MGWIWDELYFTPYMHLEKSIDLGNLWPSPPLNGIGNWREIFFCTSQVGYVLKDSKYLYTLNQGQTWTESPFLTVSRMNAICFVDSGLGWAVGNDGWIQKTTNSGGVFTNVEQEDKNLASSFVLYQNYPNPFNPITKINYEIPNTEFILLKIFDILGTEAAILINEEQPAGKYSVQFDGSNLTSGIYFYQLKADSYIATKKFILLK